jgi:ABC-type amino acid transport system permease subunit
VVQAVYLFCGRGVSQTMVTGGYRDLFVVISTAGATLIGLLFVAMSISESRSGARPKVIRQFRAAAAFLAFVNALAVSLFGLVPGTNAGIPALVLGISGLLFTAAGVRTTLRLSVKQNSGSRQPVLVALLFLTFGFQLWFGILLTLDVQKTWALGDIGNVLIVSLLIGIARSWELVGEWNTSVLSSIILLLGSSAPIATEHVETEHVETGAVKESTTGSAGDQPPGDRPLADRPPGDGPLGDGPPGDGPPGDEPTKDSAGGGRSTRGTTQAIDDE